MMIIDTHVHIFKSFSGIKNGKPIVSLGYGEIKIGNETMNFMLPSFKDTNSTTEMLLAHMDCYGIEKAVVLPNIFYGYHNDYNLEAVRKHPEKLISLALVDITQGRDAADELEKLLHNKEFRGLKIEVESAFQFSPNMQLQDNAMMPIWEICDSTQSIVMIHMLNPQNIISMKKVIQEYRNCKFVFCHMGAEAAFNNAKGDEERKILTETVRKNQNAWYEAATMPAYIDDEYYPFVKGSEYLQEVYTQIGAEKILWGSDYPGMLPRGTYKQLIDYVMTDCNKIPKDDMSKIMGKNAQEIFFE